MPDVIARTVFPRILQSYMDRFAMSQVDVAKHVEVTKQTVSDWVNGKKFPSVDRMQALANLFGVKMSDMYTPSFDNPNPILESSLDDSEIELITLWRGADDKIRKVVISTLKEFQKKDMSSKAE